MKPIGDGDAFDSTNGLDLPRYGRMFLQTEMSPLIAVVVELSCQNAMQMTFIENDQVTEALATYTANNSLRESVGKSNQLHSVVTVREDIFE